MALSRKYRLPTMKLEQFAMERMQSTYENLVEFNLSESGVRPLSARELVEEPGDEVVMLVPNYMQTWGLSRAFGATIRESSLVASLWSYHDYVTIAPASTGWHNCSLPSRYPGCPRHPSHPPK